MGDVTPTQAVERMVPGQFQPTLHLTDRRRFILRNLGGAVGWLMMGGWSAPGWALTELTSLAAKSPFDSANPKIERLAEEVFHQCVLDKIRPPEGLLKHHWLQAGTGKDFYGQWIWDTMFVVDLLAILPGQQELIREIFQNYWGFQTRWNEKRPDYAHDMIACIIDPRSVVITSSFKSCVGLAVHEVRDHLVIVIRSGGPFCGWVEILRVNRNAAQLPKYGIDSRMGCYNLWNIDCLDIPDLGFRC
jgi:hypothetical protein